jgi:MSHA biogenesis protein MshJ
LAEVNARIAAEERKFTAPETMRAVLEELLAKNRRVQLMSLKTLPMSSIAEERAPASPPAGQGKPPAAAGRLIFRHGVELTVAGSYLDILAYLGDLEKLPTQLYWSGLGLEAQQYPTVTLKVTVFTLSLDRAWLQV